MVFDMKIDVLKGINVEDEIGKGELKDVRIMKLLNLR